MSTLDQTIDARLMNRQLANAEEERVVSERMRELRSPQSDSLPYPSPLPVGREGYNEDGSGMSLRERWFAHKQREEQKKSINEKMGDLGATVTNMGSAYLLKAAWLNLIPSFGLTLIYVNIHILGRLTMGDAFCRLGEEWLPKEAKDIAGGFGQSGSIAIGIIEAIVLIIIDIAVAIVIMGALALIMIIINFAMSNWFEKFYLGTKYFVDIGWGGISAIWDLFSGLLSG